MVLFNKVLGTGLVLAGVLGLIAVIALAFGLGPQASHVHHRPPPWVAFAEENLRAGAPVLAEVRVSFSDIGPGVLGHTYGPAMDQQYVEVLLSTELTELEAIMVLVHEWAHVLVIDAALVDGLDPWDVALDDGEHGPRWAAAYVTSFRAVFPE